MSALFTIEINLDYMSNESWHSFHFFHNEEDFKKHLDDMKCWSGNITVLEKIPLHKLGSEIDRIYTKYRFPQEAKDEVEKLYREYADDEVNNYLQY